MKRLINLTLAALIIAAVSAPSLEAQSRSGSNSRGGSNTRQQEVRRQQTEVRHRQTDVRKRETEVRRQESSVRPQQPDKQQARPQQPNRPQQQARPQQPDKQQARPQQPSRPSGTNVRPSSPDYSRAQRREPQPGRVQHRPVRNTRPGPPPARREPVHHSSLHSFWHHGPHHYGYRVTVIPSHHVRHVHWGISYYIADNIYYRLINGNYYVCRPPYGVVFNPLAESIAYAACSFAFYTSILNTYSTVNQNANLITQQNATIAANNAIIAQQNETIALNNRLADQSYSLANSLGLVQSYGDASLEYFYDDGVFFTKKADGSYVTMVPPAGALVQELPEDYQMRTLSDGNEYYVVDNTVFRLAVVNGSAYFEVIGQLTGSI